MRGTLCITLESRHFLSLAIAKRRQKRGAERPSNLAGRQLIRLKAEDFSFGARRSSARVVSTRSCKSARGWGVGVVSGPVPSQIEKGTRAARKYEGPPSYDSSTLDFFLSASTRE